MVQIVLSSSEQLHDGSFFFKYFHVSGLKKKTEAVKVVTVLNCVQLFESGYSFYTKLDQLFFTSSSGYFTGSLEKTAA